MLRNGSTPFSGLSRVGELFVADNGELTSLSGLDALTIVETFVVMCNPLLPDQEVVDMEARLGIEISYMPGTDPGCDEP